jgi:hypothetical protein
MKGLTLEIKPLKGFGELEFGDTPEEAVKYLGPPSEEEIPDEDEDLANTLVYHYDEDGISIYFDDPDEPVLSNFETDNPDVNLFGNRVFQMKEEDIIKLMKEQGYEDLNTEEVESDEEDVDYDKWLSFEDAMIDFLFQKGKLLNVSWGAFFDEEDFDDDDEA